MNLGLFIIATCTVITINLLAAQNDQAIFDQNQRPSDYMMKYNCESAENIKLMYQDKLSDEVIAKICQHKF